MEKKQAGKFRAYFERNCSEIMFVFHAKTVNVGISKLQKNYTALRHILNLEKNAQYNTSHVVKYRVYVLHSVQQTGINIVVSNHS